MKKFSTKDDLNSLQRLVHMLQDINDGNLSYFMEI